MALDNSKLDGQQINGGSGGAANSAGEAAPVLQRSANRWVPPSQSGKTISEDEITFRKLRSILNKLTVEKYDNLLEQIHGAGLNNIVVLQGLVILLFDKAVDEPHFSSMYAEVCHKLSTTAPNFDPPGSKSGPTFRRLLVKRCQEEFKNRTTIFKEFDRKASEGPLSADDEERRLVAKLKMLGNIKFIGEIGKFKLISERILHDCIQELLGKVKIRNADVDDVECLCKLLTTVGKLLDHERAAKFMKCYFDRIQELASTKELPARIRFMLQEIIEMRSNHWVPRREVNKPKTLKEIREEFGMINPHPNQGRNRFGSPQMCSPRMQYGGQYPRPPGNFMNQFQGPMGGVGAPISQYAQGSRGFSTPIYGMGMLGPEGPMGNNQYMGGPGFGRSVSSSGGMPMQRNDSMGGRGGNIRANQRSYDGEISRVANINLNQNKPDELERLRLFQQEKRTAATHNLDGPSLRPQNTMLPHGILPPSTTNLPPSSHLPNMADPGLNVKFTLPPKPKSLTKIKCKEDIDGSVKKMLQDLYTSSDMDEALKVVKEWEATTFNVEIISLLFKQTLEANKPEQRKAVARLIGALLTNKVVSKLEYTKGLKTTVNLLNDLRLDNPMADQYMTDYLSYGLKSNLLTLREIYDVCVVYHAAVIFLDVLVNLGQEKEMEEERRELVANRIKGDEIELSDLLPENKRSGEALFTLLKEKNLVYLVPLLLFESELGATLAANNNMKATLKWILDQPAAKDIKDPQLIMVIGRKVIEHCTANTTFNTTLTEKDKKTQEIAKFKEYCPLLVHFTTDQPALQLALLYALQVFCFDNNWPSDFMFRSFQYFYKLDVCDDEAFTAWKEDVNEKLPGKGKALFEVNKFLNWLEASDDEDD